MARHFFVFDRGASSKRSRLHFAVQSRHLPQRAQMLFVEVHAFSCFHYTSVVKECAFFEKAKAV